jgi:hypothetical protein
MIKLVVPRRDNFCSSLTGCHRPIFQGISLYFQIGYSNSFWFHFVLYIPHMLHFYREVLVLEDIIGFILYCASVRRYDGHSSVCRTRYSDVRLAVGCRYSSVVIRLFEGMVTCVSWLVAARYYYGLKFMSYLDIAYTIIKLR